MVFLLPDKYIDPFTDFGFKRLFGTEDHKQLLIDFLNTLLPDYHHVQDLTFKNSEFLGNTWVDRKAIFDIYCQTNTGQRIIVEMQKVKQNFFKDRSVYYATFPIQEQARKGTWDFELTAVYTVGILDFVFDDHRHEDTLIHTVELKDQHCQVFYDKLKFIYVELPKFTKSLEELETQGEKWLYILRHLEQFEEPPESLYTGIFKDLFEVAEIANFSPMEQGIYQQSLKAYRDNYNTAQAQLQEAREEGLQEGRQKGLQEGRQEKRVQIARQLKALGLGISEIAVATGLTEVIIEQL
ncbi:MAG: Rpn family recombination-promoting nuclease/putative transposase [Cyanobacteria bacterium J06642_11]